MANLHVSISAEPIAQIGSFQITNSLFTSLIVSALLIIFSLLFALTKKKDKPKGLQNIVEILIESLYKLTKDVSGEQKARIFFPLITTSFIFILFNNWAGLLPGVGTIGITHNQEPDITHETASVPQVQAAEEDQSTATSTEHEESVASTAEHQEAETNEDHSAGPSFTPIFRAATADLNTTLALAIISVFFTQFYGFKYQGLSYLKKFFNFGNPINTFVGILELVSEAAKIISFAFRLFGNIFAGEVLLAVTAFLIPALAPIPFLGLEVFVGLIQALVFAMLTLVFMNMATISQDH